MPLKKTLEYIYSLVLAGKLVLGWADSDPSLSYLYDRLRPRNDKDLHALTIISQTIKEVLLYDHLYFLNKFSSKNMLGPLNFIMLQYVCTCRVCALSPPPLLLGRTPP